MVSKSFYLNSPRTLWHWFPKHSCLPLCHQPLYDLFKFLLILEQPKVYPFGGFKSNCFSSRWMAFLLICDCFYNSTLQTIVNDTKLFFNHLLYSYVPPSYFPQHITFLICINCKGPNNWHQANKEQIRCKCVLNCIMSHILSLDYIKKHLQAIKLH
jgi:hypothetical protein